jgi:hypothetical protein
VERANNDLVLFALAAVAASLACRSRGLRLIGYGAALLAGLLKYYPMTILALATREKLGRFLFVVVLVGVGIGLFLLSMGHDLVRALKLIPTGDWYGDMFGSSTVAGGLSQLFGWPSGVRTTIHLAMSLGAMVIGLRLAVRPDVGSAVSGLDEKQQAFLLVGALLTLSCFFTAQNIGYRAVHLVLTLPAMLAMARAAGESRLLKYGPVLVLLLLWAEGWRNALQQLEDVINGNFIRFFGWGLREMIWWTVITFLIACVTRVLGCSEMGQRLFPRLLARPVSADS